MTQELLQPNDLIVVTRRTSGISAMILPAGGQSRPLERVLGHTLSSAGFDYGYGGDAPAALALAILTVCVGKDFAEILYHQFKRERIAPESSIRWTIKCQQVKEWAEHEMQTGLR